MNKKLIFLIALFLALPAIAREPSGLSAPSGGIASGDFVVGYDASDTTNSAAARTKFSVDDLRTYAATGSHAFTTTGDGTFGGLLLTGDTSAGDSAALGYTATEGLILTGQGSTNDITIKNDADQVVMQVPTGGTAVDFPGSVTFADLSVDDLAYTADTLLTIATGAVTRTQAWHTIAAETGTADDLATISGGAEGNTVILMADTGDTITIKDGTGNIDLAADVSLSGAAVLSLIFDGTNWRMMGAEPGGGGSSAFSSITGGTNTAAAMLVGTGASLGPTGTGTIEATGLKSATTTVSVSAATAPTAGQVLTATSGTAATWQQRAIMVYKSADTSRNTTTTATADPDLSVTLAASSLYRVEISIRTIAADGAPGMKIEWTTPTLDAAPGGFQFAGANGGNENAWTATQTPTANLVGRVTHWKGFIHTSAGGTFSLNWAQNVSNAADTTLRKGSYMRFEKLN